MHIHSWGRYPKVKCFWNILRNEKWLKDFLQKLFFKKGTIIPHGNGRSYGDSALNERILWCKYYDNFLEFDREKGILWCQAGVLLSEILEVIVPEGWFLKITPGTKYITLGGAIASDVHGKNHHIDGCFSECVQEMRVMLPDGSIKVCKKRDELFHATCGGMGLTGVIIDAKILLKRIKSQKIRQITIKTSNLEETFNVFEQFSNYPYSVAWVDCLTKPPKLGRSIVTLGDFIHDGDLSYNYKKALSIPLTTPSFTINSVSTKLFNNLYYWKAKEGEEIIDFESFFYPLDKISNWNILYGNKGFLQYQFILPKIKSYDGISEVLERISKSKYYPTLAVLKLYGKQNDNYLSFPMEGYSIALDFKITSGIFQFLDELDKVVLKYGGRFYLSKDARLRREVFEVGYPKLDKFRRFRKETEADNVFQSFQSRRLGL